MPPGAALLLAGFLEFQQGGGWPAVAVSLCRPLAWLAILSGAAAGVRWGTGNGLSGWRHLVWNGTAGLGGLMALGVAAGQLPHGFTVGAAGALPAVLFALALVEAKFHRRQKYENHRGPGFAAGAVVSLVGAVGLLWNRVPPVFFDTLAYHFAQPELWLIGGRLQPEAWSLMSWFPPGMSVLYGIGLAWGGHAAAADANLLMVLLGIGLVADLAARLWGGMAAAGGAAAMALLPQTLYALGVPAADLGHGVFTFAALACWLNEKRGEPGSWLATGVMCCTGAVLTKYLGLLIPLGLLPLLWLTLPTAGGGSRVSRWRQSVVLGGIPVLLLLPWLAANASVTGNPVAPALSGVMPIHDMAPGGGEAFRLDARGGRPVLQDLLHLPRQLVTGSAASEGIYPSPAWGWLPLGIVAGWLLTRPRPRAMLVPGMLFLTLFAAWWLTYRWERFLVAASMMGALMAAGVVAHLARQGRVQRLVLVLMAVLALTGAGQALIAVQRFTGGLSVALGQESPGAFQVRVLPFHALFQWSNRHLAADAHRLLLLGEMRHFGLSLPHAAPTGFNRHPLVEQLRSGKRHSAVTASLRRQGFTHLAVDFGWLERSSRRYPSLSPLATDDRPLRLWLQTLGAPVWQEGSQALWLLPDVVPAP